MRILYHHRTLSKDGQDVHITEMIEALTRRGHEVIVVAPKRRGGALPRDSSRLRRVLPRWLAELMELGYSVPAFVRLWRAWRQHRPDMFYERYNLFLLSGIWLKALSGIPMLLEVNAPIATERGQHGGLSWPALARWSERRVWRNSDMLLPVTAVLAQHLRSAGVPRRPIQVIANGVALHRLAALPQGDEERLRMGLQDKLVLGFAGFIRPWHGLPGVLEAMALLPEQPSLHLLVVGDGPGRSALEERARQLGMTDRLTITGVVPRDSVWSHVAAFDIALQPHAVEYASPLKLFDYMALGRAIIAPDQANIREVLTDGQDALLFDPADPANLGRAIQRLAQDPGLRHRLGSQAVRTIARGGYNWDANAAKVEAIALALIAARRVDDSAARRTAHPSSDRQR
jgi:glycosyltransferase involved in cell wall biosynthesis